MITPNFTTWRMDRAWQAKRAITLLACIALFAGLIPFASADAQGVGSVIISELFYNPDGQDEGHEFVELHNTTASPIDLSGWQITGGVDVTFASATTVGPNGFLVVAQNAADFTDVFGFAPTAEFAGALANSGETLTLRDPVATVIDEVTYDDLAPWPTSADGGGDSLVSIDASLDADDPARWVAGTPTPQVANNPVLDVVFSVQRGWFSSSQTLTLTPSVSGATVFYNTSGSGVATVEYTGPITIADNNDIQVIQAQASFGGQASALITHTYVFKTDTGAPVVATWPNGLAVADGEDEETRSFEFLPPPSTGLSAVSGNAGVSPSAGGAAAGRSDKVFFRGAYGNGTLKGDLFGDNYYGVRPTTSIDQLFLRDEHADGTHLRQIIAHDALLETGQLSPHGRFVQYYEGGINQGVRHMQERPEGGFMESYTGLDKDDWLAWSTHEVTPGSGVSNGLGGETMGVPFSSWADAVKSIDPDSLIDYLLVQWQAKVSDYRNIKNLRVAGPIDFNTAFNRNEANYFALDTERDNYRYHFFNWDMDLGYSNTLYGRGGPTGWGWAGYTSPDFVAHDLDQFIEFRLLASDRIACAYFDGGPLTPEAFAPRLEARRQELVAAGGVNEQAFVAALTTWLGNRNSWLIDEYRSPGADTTVYGTVRPNRPPWKPTTNFTGPLLQQHDPVTIDVSGGVLSITNPNGGPVYYRLDGSDPRTADGQLSADAVQYSGPVSLPTGRVDIIARSFDADEADAFQAWSPACNQAQPFDVAVSGDPGASPGEGLVISEIQYNPPTEGATPSTHYEFIELHNTTDAAINASGFSFSEGVDYTFPSGTVIAPNGYVAIIAENAIVAFVARYDPVPLDAVYGEYSGQLDNGGETLTLVDAVGGLVDTVSYSDDVPWPVEPDGAGPSLSLTDPLADNDAASSWASSRSRGTPAAPNDTGPMGDVNCDDQLTIGDALMIAQASVGTRVPIEQCPLVSPQTTIFAPAADVNGSGAIDIGDALLVAQCTVGLTNSFCPE